MGAGAAGSNRRARLRQPEGAARPATWEAVGRNDEESAIPACRSTISAPRRDDCGRPPADRVPAHVALQLRASPRRPSLFVARLGGEEFLVVLRDTALPEAVSVLEQARREVAALRDAPGEDASLGCTISIGVVERIGQEGADALLQRADAALYEANRQGRDRVVVG